MTPPRAIIVMCRCFKLWRSPLEGEGVLVIFNIVTHLAILAERLPPAVPRADNMNKHR